MSFHGSHLSQCNEALHWSAERSSHQRTALTGSNSKPAATADTKTMSSVFGEIFTSNMGADSQQIKQNSASLNSIETQYLAQHSSSHPSPQGARPAGYSASPLAPPSVGVKNDSMSSNIVPISPTKIDTAPITKQASPLLTPAAPSASVSAPPVSLLNGSPSVPPMPLQVPPVPMVQLPQPHLAQPIAASQPVAAQQHVVTQGVRPVPLLPVQDASQPSVAAPAVVAPAVKPAAMTPPSVSQPLASTAASSTLPMRTSLWTCDPRDELSRRGTPSGIGSELATIVPRVMRNTAAKHPEGVLTTFR